MLPQSRRHGAVDIPLQTAANLLLAVVAPGTGLTKGLAHKSFWQAQHLVIHGSGKGAEMNRDLFWLMDALFPKIRLQLPSDTRGKERLGDRRVISGIVHVLRSGGRWIDAPPE